MARKQTATKESPAAEAAIDLEPLPAPAAPPAGSAEPVPAPGEPKALRRPDVEEMKSIRLSAEGHQPRLRLRRSYRFNQLQISADQEFPPAAREQLHEAGWRDRTEEEGIWTKQLPPRAKEGEEQKPSWPTVIEAERLFHDIANTIRAGNKLPPVVHERDSAPSR